MEYFQVELSDRFNEIEAFPISSKGPYNEHHEMRINVDY